MPVMRCQKNGKKGWKWGKNGTCYTGLDGRARAEAQGRAIEANKQEKINDKKYNKRIRKI